MKENQTFVSFCVAIVGDGVIVGNNILAKF